MAVKKRRKRGRRSSFMPVFWSLAAVFGVILTVGAAALVTITEAGLPAVPTWEEYADSIPKVTRIRAADNSVIHEVFTQRRTLIFPDSLPPLLVNAVLAAEDSDFMTHAGLSYAGIARAMLNNLWRGRISQGGSTITQQVVKQVLLTPERTFQRKFKELLLTRQFEMKLSKNEILAMYMSTIYMGHGRFGFEEATRFYFGKRTCDLSVQEAALLAGLVSSPEGNSLIRNPDKAMARQRHVLKRMAELDMITEEQAEVAAGKTILLWGREESGIGSAPYFVDAVVRELKGLVGPEALDRGGLDVLTTLDPKISSAAHEAVSAGLRDLYRSGRRRLEDERGSNKVHDLETGKKIPPPPRAVLAERHSCRVDEEQIFVTTGSEKRILSVESLDRLGFGRRRNVDEFCGGEGPVAVSQGVGDVETVYGKLQEVNAELGPQASMVIIDSSTRAVRALVGGDSFRTRRYNRAIRASMPIGSTIKPFIYAAALADGIPADREWANDSVAFRGRGGRLWKPRNYGGVYDGRMYDMAGALRESINVIAVRVLSEVGVARVAALMESVGFKGSIPRDLSMALGSVDATPLQLANAYAVFGNGGKYDSTWLIEQVTDFRGKVLKRHESRPGQVIARPVARAMKAMLRQVVRDGTARGLKDMSGDVWGKTGTTNQSREAWFAGGRDNLVGAVLVAYDDRLPMPGATGGNTAVPLFREFLRHLSTEGM